jgi:hypothetical protein
LASRQETIKFIEIVLKQTSYEFLQFSENYRTSKSKHLLAEIISQLIIWLADLVYLENEPEQITNLDNTELLEECYHQNPQVDCYVNDMMFFLETMQKKLDRHVHSQLILFEIYNRFVEIFPSKP